MYGSQVGLLRLDLRAEGKLMHARSIAPADRDQVREHSYEIAAVAIGGDEFACLIPCDVCERARRDLGAPP